MAVGLSERRRFLVNLLPCVLKVRAKTGRPHWLIIDEAHHFAPRFGATPFDELAQKLSGTALITVDPKWLPVAVLQRIDVLIALGSGASGAVAAFAKEAGIRKPDMPNVGPGEALLWSRQSPGRCRAVKIENPKQTHGRHRGKYAMGDVGPEHSFYFHGSAGQSVRRARNLAEFIHVIDEIGDDLWERHLRAGDFTLWFRDVVQDEELARQGTEIATDRKLSARESRRQLKDAIRRRYAITDQRIC